MPPTESKSSTTTTTTTTTTAARANQNGCAASAPASTWKVRASDGAMNTSNPIREIIETMNLAENPNKSVIPLSIGDPTIFGNLKPCSAILDAIQRANASGKYYGYQTAAGMESARKAVAAYHNKCTGVRAPDARAVREHDVILASGCSHAIDLCICVLARSGQNILIPRPGFPLYKTLTSVYGVKFKQYNLLADKNWSVDLKHLESLIDDNTTAIVINNPSNPCGSVFSKRHLLEILELAERHRLPIISDEIYDKFVFSPDSYARGSSNGSSSHRQRTSGSASAIAANENRQPSSETNEHHQVAGGCKQEVQTENDDDDDDAYDDVDDDDDDDDDDETTTTTSKQQFHHVRFRSLASLSETVPILTCGGISKTCLIPGLRLGWIIINDKKNIFDSSIRHGLNRLTQRLMGPNSLVQGALHDILTNVPDDFYKQTMDFIFKNAKLCCERLLKVRGLQPYMPQGSMYLMVGFNAKLFPGIDGDLDFTSKLMNEQSVLVLPGKCFDFPNFFRICLTVPMNVMEEALNRIEEFCRDHVVAAATAGEAPEITKQQISDTKEKLVDCSTKQVAVLKQNNTTVDKPLQTLSQQQHQQQQAQQRAMIAVSAREASNQQQHQNFKQQQQQQNHQQASASILVKKPFKDLTIPSSINGNQQLARSKCK